jgi:hypothetical protein
MARHFERKLVSTSELKTIICAWRGCTASCDVDKHPAGWRTLMVYGGDPLRLVGGHAVIDLHRIPKETWDRDGVLCPQHATALEGLLKEIGNRLKGSAGTA